MVRNMAYQNGQEQERSNIERIKANDLEEPTLSSGDNYYAVWSVTGTKNTAYAGGFGPRNRDFARGWSDLDIQNDDGEAIEGKGRFVVYSDEEMDDPMAYSDTFDLSDLRAAVDESRTDKEVIAGMVPFAGDSRVLAFEIKPRDSSVDDVVSASDSEADLGLAYSKLR